MEKLSERAFQLARKRRATIGKHRLHWCMRWARLIWILALIAGILRAAPRGDLPMRIMVCLVRGGGRVWLNPPYGAEARLWLARLAEHGDGIALIPPRLGAKWFHEVVLDTFDSMLFHKGRIAFLDPSTGLPVKGNNADSVFVAYGERNTAALAASGLPGKLWRAS